MTLLEIEPAAAINMISKRVNCINVQTRTVASENTWPPEQLKTFIPLLLIHRPQSHYTPDQVTAMAKLMYTGGIDDIAASKSVIGDQSAIKRPRLDNRVKFQKFYFHYKKVVKAALLF